MFFDEFYYSTNLNPTPWFWGNFVYDKDDGDNKGGDGDAGGAGGDGGGKEGDDGGKKDEEPKTWTIKDGTSSGKVVTEAEMLELATKSAGADEKFRVAADKLKEAAEKDTSSAKATKIVELHDKLYKTGDFNKSDIREFGELVGLGADEMEKMFAEELKKQGKSAGANDDGTPFRKLKVEDLDPDIQETLRGAKQSQVVDAEKKITEMVEKAVDKDEILGKILKETDEKQRDDRKAAINEMVKKDVNRRILQSQWTKEVFGDSMIKGSVQEIRANIKRFGIPDKASKQPPSSLLAGLGLSGELQTKIQTDEKIERVPADHPDYVDTIVAKLAQAQNVR